MAEAFTVSAEQRKSFWRGSRKLVWSAVLALGFALIFGWVKLETILTFGAGTIILVALWIASYHLLEYVKRR